MGVGRLRDSKSLVGVAVIGFGVALIGSGIAALPGANLKAMAAIGLGMAVIGIGVGMLRRSDLVLGMSFLAAGVATAGIGVGLIRDRELLQGITWASAGVAGVGLGVAALRHHAPLISWIRALVVSPANDSAEPEPATEGRLSGQHGEMEEDYGPAGQAKPTGCDVSKSGAAP